MPRIGLMLGVLLCITILILSALANAAELKVLDQSGLIRLIKQNAQETQSLCAEVRKGGITLSLINRDGLESDIAASLKSEKTWRFESVKPGIWQVAAQSKEEIVALVICE